MTFALNIGWWAIPLAITIASFTWAIVTPAKPSRGAYSFPDPMPAIRLAGALILSLVSWLAWALLA